MNPPAKSFYVQVGQLDDAKAFFRDCLGMETEPAYLCDNEKYILVKPNSETNIFLSESKHKQGTKCIVLKSDDCIEDYCRLKERGVFFKNHPVYLNEGLCAEFSDPFGNHYTILEPRNYNDY